VRALSDCRLYGILDLGYVGPARAVDTALQMLDGGLDILQVRAKKLSEEAVAALVQQVLPLTEAAGVPLVVNDHPAIAGRSWAAAAHIGQDDFSVSEARALAGRPILIGKSTHSPAQAMAAAAEGADYIGFGPLFATPTKPDYPAIGLRDIAAVTAASSIPVFCIGGIQLKNLETVLECGAQRVVVVSDILLSTSIAERVRALRSILDQFFSLPATPRV
jgi:thiamine-phosphate pyrophosphorylase